MTSGSTFPQRLTYGLCNSCALNSANSSWKTRSIPSSTQSIFGCEASAECLPQRLPLGH